MTPRIPLAGLLVAALLAASVGAQQAAPEKPAQPSAPQKQTQPPAAPPQRAATPRPRPTVTHIVVRDASGMPLRDVVVAISGAARQHTSTGGDGAVDVTLADGVYRLRFERDGFVTLEREVTMRMGRPTELPIVLNAASAPPPPPPAPPPPPPPPAPAKPVATAGPVGPPVTISIPMFLDKNFIGRDPLKESVLGCTADATTRLLQLRDPLATHTHSDLDEALYVVAGEGEVHIGQETMPLSPGTLSVIPRGTSHSVARRGRNPLVVLSTLSGATCGKTAPPQATGK